MQKTFWLLPLFIILFTACDPQQKQIQKKTNIILILADDLGYNELGCYGQEIIKTPNIDKLAKEGMKFTQHYAGSPVCAPSRCVLMTGLHTGHSYVRDNFELGGYTDETEGGQLALPKETHTMGTFFKENGYITAAIGKWGLGGPHSEGIPNKQGFDYFYGYLCQKQAHDYYPSHLWENDQWETLDNPIYLPHHRLEGDPDSHTSFEFYKGNDYAPDKMLEKALNFISENKDTSFFLYLPVTVPHLALQVPDDEPSLEEYKNNIVDTVYTGDKGYLPNPFPRASYAAMITRMDRGIGQIMDLINKYELDENTIIIFTSDNGPTYGGIGGSDTEFFKSAKPFSGLKGSVNEGGIRVPLIIRWKDVIQPGSSSDLISSFQDYNPTFADIIDSHIAFHTDGISFLPTLLNNKTQELHPYLYWEFPAYGGQVAVRMGDWKAIRKGLKKNPDSAIVLYNLNNDIGEQYDVSDDFPEIVEQIKTIMDTARVPSELFPFPALDRLNK